MTSQPALHPLIIGARAPSFTLTGVDGRTYTLDSFEDKPILTVIFLSDSCPQVEAWRDRITAIPGEYNDVAFLGINPGPAEEQTQQGAGAYPFPYVPDPDKTVSRAFGATHTPEVFVFDQDRTLRYHGAIDSDPAESAATSHYLRDALDRLTHTGLDVFMDQTPLVGCRIEYGDGVA